MTPYTKNMSKSIIIEKRALKNNFLMKKWLRNLIGVHLSGDTSDKRCNFHKPSIILQIWITVRTFGILKHVHKQLKVTEIFTCSICLHTVNYTHVELLLRVHWSTQSTLWGSWWQTMGLAPYVQWLLRGILMDGNVRCNYLSVRVMVEQYPSSRLFTICLLICIWRVLTVIKIKALREQTYLSSTIQPICFRFL